MAYTDNLVLYMKFNGDLTDSALALGVQSSVGIAYDSNYISQGLLCDGSTTNLQLDDSTNINNTTITERTFAFWVKATSTSGGKQLIYKEGGGAKGVHFHLENNKMYFGVYSTDSGFTNVYLTASFTETSKPVFVCGIIDVTNNIAKLYIDNELKDTDTLSSVSMTSHTGDIEFGSSTETVDYWDSLDDSSNYYFTGVIDEFRIWNRILSDTELAQARVEFLDDIAGDYYYDFNTSTDFTDLLSSNVLTNSGTTHNSSGYYQGGCREWDDTNNDYLSFATRPNWSSGLTYNAFVYVKTQSGKSTYGFLANSGSTSAWTKYIDIKSDGRIDIHGGTTNYTTSTPSNWAIDEWHMLTITVSSGGTVNFYWDAVLFDSTDTTTIGGATTFGYLGKGSGNNYFNGYIDEWYYDDTNELNVYQIEQLLYAYNNGSNWLADAFPYNYNPDATSIALIMGNNF